MQDENMIREMIIGANIGFYNAAKCIEEGKIEDAKKWAKEALKIRFEIDKRTKKDEQCMVYKLGNLHTIGYDREAEEKWFERQEEITERWDRTAEKYWKLAKACAILTVICAGISVGVKCVNKARSVGKPDVGITSGAIKAEKNVLAARMKSLGDTIEKATNGIIAVTAEGNEPSIDDMANLNDGESAKADVCNAQAVLTTGGTDRKPGNVLILQTSDSLSGGFSGATSSAGTSIGTDSGDGRKDKSEKGGKMIQNEPERFDKNELQKVEKNFHAGSIAD